MKHLNPLRGRLSTFRWRTRLTLWGAAACAGLAVVAFTRLTDVALKTFFDLYNYHPGLPFPWMPFVTAPLAGMLAVWLTRKFFPGGQGSGIPQVIAATHLAARGESVSGLVSLRIACGKILVGSMALLGGFSAGREGPSVQVAASILHFSHRFLPHARAISPADLILAGGAAGIAAAFNTPLAGIVFAVEELGKRLEAKTTGILVGTIILSGLVAIALEGNYYHFGRMKISQFTEIVGPVLFYGMACGLLGGVFSRLLLWPQQHPNFILWRWRSARPVLFAGGCGLLIALVGWLGGGLSFGSGYAVSSSLLSSDALSAPWHAPVTRFVATVITYYSGIPGGIFAPCLAVGAALGASTSAILGFRCRSSTGDSTVHGCLPGRGHAIADHGGDHRHGNDRRSRDGHQPDGGHADRQGSERTCQSGTLSAAGSGLHCPTARANCSGEACSRTGAGARGSVRAGTGTGAAPPQGSEQAVIAYWMAISATCNGVRAGMLRRTARHERRVPPCRWPGRR
jgi:H+/Cl- antiporter ClcA